MIYVIRHGETDWNVLGKIQGQHDTHLTPTGIKQAERLREELKDIPFSAVFCSPLARTRDTCKIILKDRKIKTNYEPCLMERDFGEMVGKTDNFMSFWNAQKPRTAKGVESIREMETRIFPLMKKVVANPKGNVLIVTHQGPLFIIENFFGYAPADGDYKSNMLDSCGYRIYDQNTFEKTEFWVNKEELSG